MLSLIYVSTASPGLSRTAVEDIAERAAVDNRKRNVTGLLAYNSCSFMQLIEGEGEDVLDVMTRIEQDPRHGNIIYIRQDQRGARECPDWSMRPIVTPLTGIGSASVFTGSLPRDMEIDTKMLFTSFASSLSADRAASHVISEEQMMSKRAEGSND